MALAWWPVTEWARSIFCVQQHGEARLARHHKRTHGNKHSEKRVERFHKIPDSIRPRLLGSFAKGTWNFKESLGVMVVKGIRATRTSCAGGSVEVCKYCPKLHCITLFSCNMLITKEHINYSHYGSTIRKRYELFSRLLRRPSK